MTSWTGEDVLRVMITNGLSMLTERAGSSMKTIHIYDSSKKATFDVHCTAEDAVPHIGTMLNLLGYER